MRLAQYKLPVKTKFISIDKNLDGDPSLGKTKNNKKSQEEVKQ